MNFSHKCLFLSIFGLLFFNCNQNAQVNKSTVPIEEIDPTLEYFGQEKPDTTPIIFAPDIISKPDRYEFGCTLSKDGKEFYFGVSRGNKSEIYQTILSEGDWSEPIKLFQTDTFSHNDPMLSNDENRLYFISDRPNAHSNREGDIDIWYAEREGKNWSKPINAGTVINSHVDQYYISFAADETMYFASKDKEEDAPSYAFDIYRSRLENGIYQIPDRLPEQINTDRYEADVFIAPDESYMIFCSIRKNGLGNGDLYICFKNNEGNWSEAKSMGSPINTEGHELCPYVTPDGKFLFYTSNKDIYWVSTDIFENYK